ncbi:MAG: ATP-binding protein, partial [bacterium]
MLQLLPLTKAGAILEAFFAATKLTPQTPKPVQALEANALEKSRDGIKLINNWKYHSGDNPAWALPDFDDSGWETTNTLLRRKELPASGWPGIGWFRLHLAVDSTLANVPVGLRVSPLGASEIYLNGERILEFGRVGGTRDEMEGSYDRDPRIISFGAGEQVLAVRYANFIADERFSAEQRSAGFLLRLGDADRFFATRAGHIRIARGYQMLFVGVAATIALLHLLLALFYPQARENLYYAIFIGGLALMTFIILEYDFSMPFPRYVLLSKIESLAAVITVISGMRFEYSLFHSRAPRWFFFFLTTSAFMGAFYWVKPFAAKIPFFILIVAAFAEMLRVIGMAILKKKDGAWIIGIGFLLFILTGILQMLYVLAIISWPWLEFGFVYGILCLVLSMSVYLARTFAKTNKELIAQMRLAHDLKAQQLEAEKLRELDQMKSRFFANISHEFRTPLTLILGPLQHLLSEDLGTRAKEQMQMMKRQGKRLLRLINQLLDLSKLEAGQMVLRAHPGNLTKILRQVVTSFESAAVRKEIALTLQAPEVIPAFFDKDSLEKILYNLLSNALRFTPEGGRVEVEVSTCEVEPEKPSAKFVQIAVRDTGRGIPTKHLNKIFDRFYQADPSATQSHEGTGIGLALTKELIELHGGEIRVESEPGHGSTFVVRLPQSRAQLDESELFEEPQLETDLSIAPALESELGAAEKPEGSTLSASEAAAKKERPIVLVVEDSRDMRIYMRDILDKQFSVLETEDGSMGLKKAFETIPDLVISDVMMPGMNGFELCKKLKT